MPSFTKLLPSCLTPLLLSGNALSAKSPFLMEHSLASTTTPVIWAVRCPIPLLPTYIYLMLPSYWCPSLCSSSAASPDERHSLINRVWSCLPAKYETNMDEDCLSLAVFAPKGTTTSDKLPVVIWIHGGAFNAGSKQGFSLASMISHSPVKYIGVSIEYRVVRGSWILPSNLTHRANSLNLGLYDQQYAIQWVQKYISLFGGDPHQVTLFGESAGATSVGYHLLHVDGPPPFKRVIMDSGGPTARAFPDWTYPLYQTQTDEFLNLTGCYRGANETATFSCLRGISMETIRNASVSVFNKYDPAVTWPFQPVVDYQFSKFKLEQILYVRLPFKVARPAHESWESGQVNNVSVFTGFNSDEGSIFVHKNLNTTEEFKGFFRNLAPKISDSQLDALQTFTLDPTSLVAYGDFAYISQVQANAVYASKLNMPVWKYHFAYLTSDPDGVKHGSELQYVNTVIALDKPREVADQAKIMNAYWSSCDHCFWRSNKVNSSAPAWPRYTTQNETQIRFSNGTAYTEPDNIRRNATDFWRSIPDVLMH
ncbi:Carboxylesterase family [Rhizoctonia solani]|uniref:Carboxylic ester hydrolase n=1 Tax=Rhizoctonia solani TaxID=456999 RepID=A0A8H7M1U1_9AGAM|nr:Carboxylesterase family [Rhizoctonia solani]